MYSRMFTQTFGVEIEFIGTLYTREEIADMLAEQFDWDVEYVGGSSYDIYDLIDDKSRRWSLKKDVSLRNFVPDGDRDFEVEMSTPILQGADDLKLLLRVVELLVEYCKCKVSPELGCGMHVHIGAESQDYKSLIRLSKVYASHEDMIYRAVGVSESRVDKWCKKTDTEYLYQICNDRKITDYESFRYAWYSSHGCTNIDYAIHSHYQDSRYHGLNLHSYFTRGTVEFRLYEIDNEDPLFHDKIASYVMLSLVLCQNAMDTKSASYKSVQKDNEKFAMRTWLNRMHCIGPEFATMHKTLRANLCGEAGFRYGAKEYYERHAEN